MKWVFNYDVESSSSSGNAEQWKEQWNHSFIQSHFNQFHLPHLSRKESLHLFTSLLDFYSSLIDHFETMVNPSTNTPKQNVQGFVLSQLFNITEYVMSVPKAMRSFISQFLQTQVCL